MSNNISKLGFPKLLLQIEGKGVLKDLYHIETFNPKVVVWNDKIDLNSGFIEIYNNNMLRVPVRKVIYEIPMYKQNVETEWYTVVRTTIYDVLSSSEISYEEILEGLVIKNYPKIYSENLRKIEIKVTSSDKKDIFVTILGWEDEI